MQFSTDAVTAEIPLQMQRIISITGRKPWKRRLHWLNQQIRTHPTISYYLVERFGLELAFQQVRRHHKQTGRYPWPPETAEQQRFYSFLAIVTRCHFGLRESGKTRMKGMLKDALKNDLGFVSLAFEMKVAAHLMRHGFDVNFSDMEKGGGFDYLAEKDGIELEIECKLITGDIGRQIHLRKFHQLGSVLLPEMRNLLNDKGGGNLVRILIPGRLSGTADQHQLIRKLMLRPFSGLPTHAEQDGYEVLVSNFDVAGSPFTNLPPDEISMHHIQQFLAKEFEIENKNALVQFHPRKGVVLVIVESTKKDSVLKGIHRQLKQAARSQFSGNRPAFLCCELAEMTEKNCAL